MTTNPNNEPNFEATLQAKHTEIEVDINNNPKYGMIAKKELAECWDN